MAPFVQIDSRFVFPRRRDRNTSTRRGDIFPSVRFIRCLVLKFLKNFVDSSLVEIIGVQVEINGSN